MAKFTAISYILWCEQEKIKSLRIYIAVRGRKREIRSATETAVLVTWTILSICSPGTCRTLRRIPRRMIPGCMYMPRMCIYIYTHAATCLPYVHMYVHTRDALAESVSLLLENSIPRAGASRMMADTRSIVFREGKVSRSPTKGSSPAYRARFTCVIEEKRTCMHR